MFQRPLIVVCELVYLLAITKPIPIPPKSAMIIKTIVIVMLIFYYLR